jgi:hypothetical protein
MTMGRSSITGLAARASSIGTVEPELLPPVLVRAGDRRRVIGTEELQHALELGAARRILHVAHDLVLDAALLEEREGAAGLRAALVVPDRHVSHDAELRT